MLWLPDPTHPRRPLRLAVADSSVEALEQLLVAPDESVAAWNVAQALLDDPWLVTWVDAWRDPGASYECGLPFDMATWIATQTDMLVATWAQRGATAWGRPERDEVDRRARIAVAQPPVHHPPGEVPAETWQRHVHRCRALPAAAGISIDIDLLPYSRYTVERPGCDRRLPRLVSRLAAPLSAQEFASKLNEAKMASLVELAYGASHEINNPLANIAGRAQTLLHDEKHPDRRRTLAAIQQQALRAHEMISDLMLVGRPPALHVEACDLAEIAQRVKDELGAATEQCDIAVHFAAAEGDYTLTADATQLAVAIRAILQNAIDSIGQVGRIDLELTSVDGQHTLRVADTGAGLTPRELEHAFDPFFSGREAGRGLGFGLSKAWRIVTQHGGTITIENRPIGGAEVLMHLPTQPLT